jgi:hypothetical protein
MQVATAAATAAIAIRDKARRNMVFPLVVRAAAVDGAHSFAETSVARQRRGTTLRWADSAGQLSEPL